MCSASTDTRGGCLMESSIRKNWLVAAIAAILVVVALVLVVSIATKTHQQLIGKQTHNDLKWIGRALHQYHDRHGKFPPVAIRDEQGRPIHSWRSLIQRDLADVVETDDDFREYDLSQPWDSETNRNADTKHRFGNHPYQFLAIVGPNAAWDHQGTRSTADFADRGGTALVIGVRNTGIRWGEPADAHVSDGGMLTVDGRNLDLTRDVFLLTADGAVRYARDGIPAAAWSALVTINAAETVPEW